MQHYLGLREPGGLGRKLHPGLVAAEVFPLSGDSVPFDVSVLGYVARGIRAGGHDKIKGAIFTVLIDCDDRRLKDIRICCKVDLFQHHWRTVKTLVLYFLVDLANVPKLEILVAFAWCEGFAPEFKGSRHLLLLKHKRNRAGITLERGQRGVRVLKSAMVGGCEPPHPTVV